jgi:UDPglucose 6-dehydrogenase
MNITVAGLWHLGSVTAACCARHFRVTGFDPDPATVEGLARGKAPLFEPGLEECLAQGLQSGQLRFTHRPEEAGVGADLFWCTWDTPVDDHDRSDAAGVLAKLRPCLPFLRPGTLVLLSSQLPVGTCRQLESEHPRLHFACSPENLRLGKAIESFTRPERVVIGLRREDPKKLLAALFQPFTDKILWMSPESAEMVKHSLNAFLALSITFINEIALLCERTGADANDVAAGLKSDSRIGPKAYLGPGGPFAGGTLARDVVTLTRLAEEWHEPLQLIPGIKLSNDRHGTWAGRRLARALGSLAGKNIAVLGLTYTPNTDTLRRSAAVELCQQLLEAGATVQAFDPAVRSLPERLAAVRLAPDLSTALRGVDAAVVCTEWPQFGEAPWSELVRQMRRPLFVDANGFLENSLKNLVGIEHLCVGRSS